MRTLICVFFVGCAQLCLGQVKFENDTMFKYSHKEECEQISLKKPDFDLVDVEIRIWANQSLGGRDLFVLRYLNDGTKMLMAYKDIEPYKSEPYKGKPIILLHDLQGLFDTLEGNDLFILPTDNAIRDQYHYMDERINQTYDITDGTRYVFEIITKNAKRKYSYHCPITYGTSFSHVTELQKVTSILKSLVWRSRIEHELCVRVVKLPPTMN